MSTLVEAIPLIVLLIILASLYIVISGRKKKQAKDPAGKLRGKDRDFVVREATKRLLQNPRDPEALYSLAEVHFADRDFEKAKKEYEILVSLCAIHPTLDEYEMTVRFALSALNSGNRDEAYESLLIAKSMKDDGFDVNYNLGYLEYERHNYERAIACLSQARVLEPEHPGTLKYLGQSL
jgi:tetratricopeptide (TPR) repeat protein